MIRYLMKRPIAVTMILIAVMVVGMICVRNMPVSLMPDMDVPQVTVQTSMPGYSAQEMERKIIAPLRLNLSRVAGVKTISSDSRMGKGSILMKFEPGANMDMFFIEVNEKVDLAMGNLPKEMERPKIVKASAMDIPAFYLDISVKDEHAWSKASAQFAQLCDFAANVASRRLEQLPSVAMVDMSGLASSEIRCIPEQEKMESLGLTVQDIQGALAANNIQLTSLSVIDGIYRYNIHFDSQILTVDDVRNIYINHAGRLLQLKDLCQIEECAALRKNYVRHDGKNCVTLAVVKQSDAQMGDLQEAISDVVGSLQKANPSLQFDVTRDQTELLDYSIHNLEWNLLAAIFFTALVLILFLRRWRLALLVALSIPISLMITLLCFRWVGISINIISLSGLILGVGMIVDNSIIVIDNILQKRNGGASLQLAVCQGTASVFTPMLSSVLTTCSVFIPLIFVGGMAGALFFDQSMGITIALFSSLAVSVLVLPVYFYALYVKHCKHEKCLQEVIPQSKLHAAVFRYYDRMHACAFAHLRLCLCLSLLAIPGLILVFLVSDKRQMPEMNYSDGMMYVDWNANVSVEENDRRIGEVLRQCDDLTETYTSMVGSQDFMLFHTREISSSEALVYLKAKSEEMYSECQKKLQACISQRYPNATVSFAPSGNLFDLIFSSGQPELCINLQNQMGHRPSVEQAEAYVDSLRKCFPSLDIPSVVVEDNLVLESDVEQMSLYGITYDLLYDRLRQISGSNEVLHIHQGAADKPVIVGATEADRNTLMAASVKSPSGVDIPLLLLLKERKEADFKHLYGSEEGEFYPIEVNAKGHVKDVLEFVRHHNQKSGELRASVGGDYFLSRQAIQQMAWILGVSILLLFFILAAQFESLVQPFIILSEMVLDIFVVLVILYLLRLPIDMMSMTGLIVMAGIVINDSILKVDTINWHRRCGMPLLASIVEAGRERLLPILMTSLTTIFSLMPFLSRGSIGAELQFPLSLTILIGMVVGTGVSIFFVPILYYVIYQKKIKNDEIIFILCDIDFCHLDDCGGGSDTTGGCGYRTCQ